MNIVWYNENQKTLISTIQNNNITLNKTCVTLLEHAYSVMLGLDYENKVVYIKPLSKEEATRGDITEKEQYKITVKSSYARVSNKNFINEIKKVLGISDLTDPKKYIASFDDYSRSLKIDLNRGV
ncbi:MAG: hypothetical protein R3Y60_03045 [bacterium]